MSEQKTVEQGGEKVAVSDNQERVGDAPKQEGDPKFKVGDKVLVNRGLVAEVVVWDEPNNLVVYTYKVGLGTDTVTAPISHTDVRPLSEAGEVLGGEDYDHRPVPAAPTPGNVEGRPATDGSGDELTTYGSFVGDSKTE